MTQSELEKLVLSRILEEKARSLKGQIFLKFKEGEMTYGEVKDIVNRVTRGLAAQGVMPRDHVAVMLPNCAEFLYVIFALAELGAVAVPVNTAYKGEILRHVLHSSDSSLLIIDESLLDVIAPLKDHLPDLRSVVVRKNHPASRLVPRFPWPVIPFEQLLSFRNETSKPLVRYCDLQAVMYTSGTTGPSKGVMTPHALALTCARDSLKYLAYEPGETIYCPIPLFHAAALWDGAMTALLGGASIALVERFSASRFWEDVRHFNANVAMGVFSMIPILMNRPPVPTDRDHGLRAFYVGKSALDEAFRERFGVRSVETYTSTEAGIGTGSPYGRWRPGSCGQANDEIYEVKIVDEDDREVGSGEEGEMVLRPRLPFVITTGYYKFPQATADTFRNLWFHTGDRAYRDADGYFYFVERIQDCIRRRGENISAFEVEQVVNSHPMVVESAAFGVPSELEEEEVKVAVVLQEGADHDYEGLVVHCQERLPYFMVPRYIEFVGELPKTPIGKNSKHELRIRGDHGITAATWDRDRVMGRLGNPQTGKDKGGKT
ncbi:MAG: AMP-binding protein [Deltaproteobacteria bacterium]|nr:AMP-binding protein [Deltaproteobacteria bacterium]